ncbi:MAG TPA: DUF3604 domain-containing protein [Thermoanaerobaculia bacterium]|jgi:hypothetical protein|nr:DUF3604 domain-containing protein [Thermoanaerobaculia bacterium]
MTSRVRLVVRLASTVAPLLAACFLIGFGFPSPGLAQAAKPATSGGKPADNRSKPPFEITEDRPRCSNYNPKRQALFGTTHLHTGLSFDASIRFVDYANGNDPRGAYRFAQGLAPINIPEPSGLQPQPRKRCSDPPSPTALNGPSRTPCIDEPLDWGAVTDHSEHFGVMGFCKGFMKDASGKDIPESLSMECRMINGFFYQPLHAINPAFGKSLASNAFTQLTVPGLGPVSKNTNLPVCNNNPELCAKAEMEVWGEIQKAAEEAYDRSEQCKFTSFVAYENTSTPLLNNWHRNVIFRNDRVVTKPVNALDMAVRVNTDPTKEPIDSVASIVIGKDDAKRVWPVPEGTRVTYPLPQPFWNKLEEDCTNGRNVTPGKAKRCDFITIPHNSNLGGGGDIVPPMFLNPFNTADAKRHLQMEPLVEIYQDKGGSECRYDPRFLAGTNTIDEYCAFEILDSKSLSSASGVGSSSSSGPEPPDSWGDRSYVRNIWKDGIQYAARGDFDGVNPFKMGVVAASDSHTGVMGWHPENEQWPGHLGIDDAYPMAESSTIQNGTGGPSVVWAEENTRDSIFEAWKRKETYGTSGPHIKVRLFGGWNYPLDACGKDFVDIGYQGGVPMGGDLPRRVGKEGSPTFITWATWDDQIKTKLQQIQIVKGWVDAQNNEHERVYTVAGDPGSPLNPQADLDATTCKPKPDLGQKSLCSVWRDPLFDPKQHAFYYVRVLEEPVCRYSTLWCRKWIGVDPLNTSQCNTDLAALRNGSKTDKLKADQGAMCCSNQTTSTFVQPVIQERAWTSPIWYEPAARTAVARK